VGNAYFIFHFPFIIHHLSLIEDRSECNGKWKTVNGKWKMASTSIFAQSLIKSL